MGHKFNLDIVSTCGEGGVVITADFEWKFAMEFKPTDTVQWRCRQGDQTKTPVDVQVLPGVGMDKSLMGEFTRGFVGGIANTFLEWVRDILVSRYINPIIVRNFRNPYKVQPSSFP